MTSEKSRLLSHTSDSNDDGAGPSGLQGSQESRPTGTTTQPPGVPPPRGPDETPGLRSVPPVPLTRLKTVVNAYLMWFPFGLLGFHHFYLKNISVGFDYLFTLGLFGFGWVVDFWRIPMLVKAANAEIEAKWIWEHEICEMSNRETIPKFKYEKPKRISDCYLLGFTTGFLGFHQRYLDRPILGLVYMFTVGLFGVGVLSDWIRMPILLKRCRERQVRRMQGIDEPRRYYLDDAYVLAVPGGIFGFHNFYLGRYFWGFVYLVTLGLLGMGWLVDLIRMPFLVEDANLRSKSRLSPLGDVEHGVKYRSTEEDVPCIDPYYSDYNSGQSQRSFSQSDVPPTPASLSPRSSIPRPASEKSTPQPHHFKEFQLSPKAVPTDSPRPDGTVYPPHSSGAPEPPPPYAPVADPGSVLPNDEAIV